MTTALCARSAYSDRSWVRWLESSKRLKLRFYWRMGESFMIQIGRYQIFFLHVKSHNFWNFYQFGVWEIPPFACKTVTWAFLNSPPMHSVKLWLCWTCKQSGSLDYFKCTARSIEIVPRCGPLFGWWDPFFGWLKSRGGPPFGWWNLEADPLLVDEI